MSSAFGEPPASGVSRPAEATGPRSSAPATTACRVIVKLGDLRVALQLGGDAIVEPGFELALDPGVGGGRAGRQAVDEGLDLGVEVGVRHRLVDEAPLGGLDGADALAEHRHLDRAGEPDALG